MARERPAIGRGLRHIGVGIEDAIAQEGHRHLGIGGRAGGTGGEVDFAQPGGLRRGAVEVEVRCRAGGTGVAVGQRLVPLGIGEEVGTLVGGRLREEEGDGLVAAVGLGYVGVDAPDAEGNGGFLLAPGGGIERIIACSRGIGIAQDTNSRSRESVAGREVLELHITGLAVLGDGPLKRGDSIGILHPLEGVGDEGARSGAVIDGLKARPGGIEARPSVAECRKASRRGIGNDEGGELSFAEDGLVVSDVEAEAAAPPRLIGTQGRPRVGLNMSNHLAPSGRIVKGEGGLGFHVVAVVLICGVGFLEHCQEGEGIAGSEAREVEQDPPFSIRSCRRDGGREELRGDLGDVKFRLTGLRIEQTQGDGLNLVEGERRVGQPHLRRSRGDGPGDRGITPAAATLGDKGGIVGTVNVERVSAVGDAFQAGDHRALRKLAIFHEELVRIDLTRGDLRIGRERAGGNAAGGRLADARDFRGVLPGRPGAVAEGGEVERAISLGGLDGVLARHPDAAHIDRGDGGCVGGGAAISDGGEGGGGLAEAGVSSEVGREEVGLGQAAAVGLRQRQVRLKQRHRAEGIGDGGAIGAPIAIEEGLIPVAHEAVGDHRGAELLVELVDILGGGVREVGRREVGEADNVLGTAGRAEEHQAGRISIRLTKRRELKVTGEDAAVRGIGDVAVREVLLRVARATFAVEEVTIRECCGVERTDRVGVGLALHRHCADVGNLECCAFWNREEAIGVREGECVAGSAAHLPSTNVEASRGTEFDKAALARAGKVE